MASLRHYSNGPRYLVRSSALSRRAEAHLFRLCRANGDDPNDWECRVRTNWYRRALVGVSAILVMGAAMVVPSSPAFAQDPPASAHDPQTDYIDWTGNSCSTAELHVHLFVPDPTVEKSVRVGSASDCTPLPEQIITAFNPTGGVINLGGSSGGASALSGCGPYGNVIHSSHTLQDVVRIDIAWLRSSVDRAWDCNSTWLHNENDTYDRVKAWADGGPSWWKINDPVTWPNASWSCNTNSCTNAWARTTTTFHTDFLHCNVINQDIKLTTTTVSYPDGSYWVDFQKNGSCPGVFSATATKTNTDETRAGGYGGSGFCIRAVAGPVEAPSAQAPCSQQV